MATPDKIKRLVDTFDANIDSYKSSNYNETQVRQEFIDPFFIELGWDVYNTQGYAEAYKDVVLEDKIKVGTKTKAPDYSFRIGGTRKFFLEAKKPAVDIYGDIHPAYQLKRYAWSGKLPLSVLTDFEEFAVYDCTKKPGKFDKASVGRTFYYKYTEYIDKWEEIYNIFSREAILKGSFDKYAVSNKKKKGTSEVDDAFLEEMEKWRELLARNFAIRNPNLSTRALNEAVQKTIDRIVFLRICEDRGIEDYGRLRKLTEGKGLYDNLKKIFLLADEKYNSGLFHFKGEKGRDDFDDFTLKQTLDDAPIKEIIKGLYYPDSPYEFSVLPADILGQVYERFLGKVIRLTAGHQAKIEEKPEVRKAGGVFYTPTYIVDYIVKNTVGKLLENKTPEEAEKITVLDPACGSGSFLLGAYQYLLDWYLQQYVKEPDKYTKSKNSKIYQNTEQEWKLTTAERKNILLNNIYGVDIDSQAVEVTKLSLLLKVLEGETDETLSQQMQLFSERALPDLDKNIKCGNSLIGSDFYSDRGSSLFSEEDMYRINVFDWEEDFADIMKSGGFDTVIGNPPYVKSQNLNETNRIEVEYYNTKYANYVQGNYDLYILFLQKGFSILNASGKLGYILPHKFFQGQTGIKIREYLYQQNSVEEIIDFTTNQIFENATTYTCLFFLSKEAKKILKYFRFKLGDNYKSLSNIQFENFDSKILDNEMWNFNQDISANILEKIESNKYKFKTITNKIFKGSSTGNDKIFLIDKIEDFSDYIVAKSKFSQENFEIEKEILREFLNGEDIRRYKQPESSKYLIFPYEIKNGKRVLISLERLKSEFPRAFNYLYSCKQELLKRKVNLTSNDFYKYSAARSIENSDTHRIMIPDMLVDLRVSINLDKIFLHGPAIHSVVFNEIGKQFNEFYYLGILNSKLFWFFISKTSTALRGNAFRLTPEFLNPFVFPNPEIFQHDKMVELVETMLDLNKRLQAEGLDSQSKKVIQKQIDITDKQIDKLVYELYELTPDEIQIVEGE